MQLVINLTSTFMLGLLTPLTAVCVLPLYPGFLSFLSRKLSTEKGNRGRPVALGGLVTSGVILFMLLVGLVFTTLIEASLTRVIQVVSPIAFAALAVISVLLIFNVDAGKLFPQARIPSVKSPYLSALLYGFFFGAIVAPCNPGMIALVSGTASQMIVRFLVTYKAVINRVAGAIMLAISLYYLLFVFRIFQT